MALLEEIERGLDSDSITSSRGKDIELASKVNKLVSRKVAQFDETGEFPTAGEAEALERLVRVSDFLQAKKPF